MSIGKFEELFERYKGNPILTPENWPYKVASTFNPGAIKFNDEIFIKEKDGFLRLVDEFGFYSQ